MPLPFPSYLAPHLANIKARTPATQSIAFCPSNWNSSALSTHWASLYKHAPHLAGGMISRTDVKNIGVLANKGVLLWDTFFFAVMIWGFGMTGYGPWRTEQMFKSKGFAKQFTDIRDAIAKGKIIEAYKAAKIDQCGPAFFTKVFYFLGLVFGRTPLPLILDSRVCASLLKCTDPTFKPVATYFKPNASVRHPTGYDEFCNDLNSWATANGFLPDQLEIFLFCPPVGF